MLPLQLRMSLHGIHAPGLRAHFSVPLNIYGGAGGRLKGLFAEDSETVLHLDTKVWKVIKI